jgi:hypothetical protein
MVQEPAQAGGLAVSALDDPRPSVVDLHPAHAPAAAHVPEDQNAGTRSRRSVASNLKDSQLWATSRKNSRMPLAEV